MGISYRKRNNSWEYRIIYKDPITEKRIEKSKKGFRTKPEARHEAQEIERASLGKFNDHVSNFMD